jgi:fatty-acyl-CoA synthase
MSQSNAVVPSAPTPTLRDDVTPRSHISGSTENQLDHRTIGAAFTAAAAARPGSPALVSRHQNIRWTYADLAGEVERLALSLLSLGIAKGDRVGVWSQNRAEWTVTQFATARIGAILVNVNPAYRAEELRYALRHSGVRVLFTASAFKSAYYLAMIAEVRASQPQHARVIKFGDERAPRESHIH